MALSPPPTFIYTFWEGWSPSDKAAVGQLFNTYRQSIKVFYVPPLPLHLCI